MNRVLVSGDHGDITSMLPLLRTIGGGELILAPCDKVGGPREPMTPKRADFLLPLLKGQPYITDARYEETPQGITLDFSHFRAHCPFRRHELLTHWHARFIGFSDFDRGRISMAPWLTVQPSEESRGKVVVARSLRYHNPKISWRGQVAKYLDRMLFVGLPEEHESFQQRIGRRIPYRPVADALEMAQLIAGSELFMGNQSFPCWLAMALGHNLVQETWPGSVNSKVKRHNAKFLI